MTKSFDSTSLCWSARCVLLLTGFMFFIQSPFSLTAQEGLGKVKRDAVNRLELTSDYQKARAIRQYPIGVFDSGTGGLTVLEQILELDQFDNRRQALLEKGDGHRDFAREDFIFLADQANMPYGNYPVVDKGAVLDDLIVKDASFLMGREYFTVDNHQNPLRLKAPVKAIVIACNTATAYGQLDIEQVIESAGLDIKVVGVIDAGAKGAVEVFRDGKPGSIAVVPTQGTVLSGAYPKAIQRNANLVGLDKEIPVFQQGAFGLAGSIDGAGEFVNREATSVRDEYQGPSLTHKTVRIHARILPRYGFDTQKNGLLIQGDPKIPEQVQLNSPENYIRYHLVSLMEQIRQADNAQPLRAVILGCTHFPFFETTFRAELSRLRDYQENGRYIYRDVMAEEIHLIDPAFYTARELYQSLVEDNRIRKSRNGSSQGEFYITIPCDATSPKDLTDAGGFTYEYKYGRTDGVIENDFRAVPMDHRSTSQEVLERLQQRVPNVWNLLSPSSK